MLRSCFFLCNAQNLPILAPCKKASLMIGRMKFGFLLVSIILATVLDSQGQRQTSIDSLLHQLALCSEDSTRVNLLNSISRTYLYFNKEQAQIFAQQAYDISEKNGSLKTKANALDNMGHIHFYNDENLVLASQYYLQAMSIREQINDLEGMASSYNQMGNINYLQGDYEKAEAYYLQNLATARKLKHPNKFLSYSNLTSIYIKREEFEKARRYLDTSIRLSRDYANATAVNYIQMAEIHQKMNDYDSALFWYDKSMELCRQIPDSSRMIYVANLKARIYALKGDMHQAESLVNYAAEIEIRHPSFYQKEFFLEIKAMIHESRKEFELANQAHKDLIAIKDSILSRESIKKLATLEYEYQLEKDQKIRDLAARQKRLKSSILILLLTVSGLMILFLFYWQKNKAKTARLEKEKLALQTGKLESELDHRQKEITSNLLRLAEKDEIINDVVLKLKRSSMSFKKENRELIQNIISELESNTSSDFWESFEHSFLKIHTNFYNNIEVKHPDLTPNERRLCAFLKLNLSTKDIASIIHLPVASVETARVRLRKKLGLSNTKTSLVQYIAQF